MLGPLLSPIEDRVAEPSDLAEGTTLSRVLCHSDCVTNDSDDAVVSHLRTIENLPQGWGSKYTVRIVDVVDHRVDLELREEAKSARIWIALPQSGRPMPWHTHIHGDDADSWVGELLDWLSEEMDTCGIDENPARVEGSDGVVRIVADGYGFRQADAAQHERLHRGVGPFGYGVRTSRSARRRAYALEDALN